MDEDASSIGSVSVGSKGRSTQLSVIASSTLRHWTPEELAKVVRSAKAVVDALAYRGYEKARIVSIERMMSYIDSKFYAKAPEEVAPRHVEAVAEPWRPIYDVLAELDAWAEDEMTRTSLTHLDFVPVVEVLGVGLPERYPESLLAMRHDRRFEDELREAMEPDWGGADWYTTPAAQAEKERGGGYIGVMLRTSFARS